MSRYPSPFDTDIRPDSPVEAMAEQLREAVASKGFADTHDLTVCGWPAKAIDRFGPDAVALAHSRIERQLDFARAA